MEAQQNDTPVPEQRVYSVGEAHRRAGVSRTLLYEEIREGRLKVSKAGRRTLILNENLEAWLQGLQG